MFWWKRHRQTTLILLLLLILTIPVILPLLRHGFFQSDDGEWMIIRFSAFHQAFRDGQFPVRWLGRLNQGYGYPVSNFLYPAFMYLAEIPKVIGFGFVDSIKIIIGLSLISSAVFTFFWLKQIFTPLSAFTGALFYLYAPYHLWDVYKRGSVGEILALAVVPFILWMVEKKNWLFYSFGVGFLILSHNTLAVLFLPVILIYVFLRKTLSTLFEEKLCLYFLLYTFLGLGLSVFFWLPAIYDLQYTRFFQTQVSNWSEYFVNFELIGWSTLVIFTLAGVKLFFLKRYHDLNHDIRNVISVFFLLLGAFSVFLALSQSNFLWNILPASFIQFPFRLLSVTILCGAFLTAFAMEKMGKFKIPLTLILITIIFLCARSYLQPAVFFDKGESFYTTNEGTTTVQNEYMPKWVQEVSINKSQGKVAIISGEGKIDNLQTNSKEISFTLKAKTNSEIRINTLYFPGWQIWVDKQETTIDYRNPEGLMKFNVKPGSHQVMIAFSETSVRLIADIISLISLLAILSLALKKR